MSSLLIESMNMPKSCLECPFTYEGDCTADEDLTDIYSFMEERYPDCPLTELRHPDCPLVKLPTSHGRLIDADALENRVAEWRDCLKFRDAQILCTVIDMIHKAPTVIETEE